MILMMESDYQEAVEKGIGICTRCLGSTEGIPTGSFITGCIHCGRSVIINHIETMRDRKEIEIVSETGHIPKDIRDVFRRGNLTETKVDELRKEWDDA